MEVGTYTIVGPGGGHRTLSVAPHWSASEAKRGTQVISYLRGPDNGRDFKGFAFLYLQADGSEQLSIWFRFRQSADLIAAARFLVTHKDRLDELGLAYAIRSGRCYRCQRVLTVPVSVLNGLGPTCADKLGVERVPEEVVVAASLARLVAAK